MENLDQYPLMKLYLYLRTCCKAFKSPKLDLYNPSYGSFSRTATGCPVLAKPTIQIFGTDFRLRKSEILD